MASIKFGAGISAISGTIGGTVYARNRYGAYARNWAKPVNPNSDKQVSVRAGMSSLAAQWTDVLTPSERAQWGIYASNVAMVNRLGDVMYLSGFNHFCRSGLAAINAGLPFVAAGPAVLSLPSTDESITAAYAETAQAISMVFDNTEPWANEDGGALLVFTGLPVSAGKEFFAGPWRFAGAILGDTATPTVSPAVLTIPYAVQAGQKLWTKLRILRADGRLSNFFQPGSSVCS